MTTRLKLCCALLLTVLAAVSARAQIDPLSPTLSPSLTQDPATAPVTTLSIDLLATPRPFVFDPTGANVEANALEPSIYASSLNASEAQTDTQLRDSSQTGQISPYAAGATRLGVSFPGDQGSTNQGSPDSSGGGLPGSFSNQAANQELGTNMARSYQSSWGPSSSFGAESVESSWGIKPLRFDREGRSIPESSSLATSLNGDGSPPGYAADNQSGRLTRRLGVSRLSQLATVASRTQTRQALAARNTGDLGTLSSTTEGATNGAMNGYGYRQTGSRYGATTNPSYRATNGLGPGPMAVSSNIAMTGNSIGAARSANQPLNFFPPASTQEIFGASPFSAPGGNGELTFLNPDILADSPWGRSPSSIQSKHDATKDSLRQAFVRRSTLATSSTRYGLNTDQKTSESGYGTRTGGEIKAGKRPRLNSSVLDSENP